MIQYRRSLSNHPAEGINLAELNGCDIVVTGDGIARMAVCHLKSILNQMIKTPPKMKVNTLRCSQILR